ncbi:methyl-viologen-reducing hydrogenase, delta subunit [mine drainage metagenome]|uniref:Methyl-viologen-reducing hydrogenase, delta subunit n=1 Tax=mine drainage metagenome TaxID=410659 RepID=A0A1J5QAU7_9ZZZZ
MSGHSSANGSLGPRILVFSTNNISDPGIDLAGSRHLHYPAGVSTINIPCSSGIKPAWIVRALQNGFDGVFIAADGDECAYLTDCNARTARIAGAAQEQLKALGLDPQRVIMAALCSVCAEPFVKYMREFSEKLTLLGPAKVAAA